MAFFGQRDQKDVPVADQMDRMLAEYHLETLKLNHRVMRPPSIYQWSKWIAKIRKHYDQTHETIAVTLKWLRGNMKREYVPKCYSARSLYDKYPKVLDAIDRETPAYKKVVVSDKARSIADKFRGKFSNYRWPKGSADCLDAFVQVTLTGANEFRDRLKTVAKSDDKRKKDNMAAVLLKTKFMYFDHPDTFTEKWVQAVYDDIKDWDGWSGNLVSMAFVGDLDQKRMDRIGKQWATDYFGSDKPWTELKESLR